MHGHSPESVLLVNAEVDSMGGVIHGGVGIDNKTSPRQAAIEKAQAELRQEYDVREERRRELEFLEKGGNPLDFKLGTATSVSVQSTSVTDQFVTSEAKGSFALTASPHGDSVESSGGPEPASAREINTADNLLLFDGENDTEGDRNSSHLGRSNVAKSEQLPQLDGCRNIKEAEDSGVMRFVKNQVPYARRNRSRSGRDGMRISSTEIASAGGGNGSVFLPSSRHSSRDAKGSFCEKNTQKGHIVNSTCKTKSTSPNRNVAVKTVDMGLDISQARATPSGIGKGDEGDSDATSSKELRDREQNQHTQVDAEQVPNKVSVSLGLVRMKEERVTSAHDCMPCASMSKTENLSSADQPNGFSTSNGDVRDTPKDGQNGDTACKRKGSVDSESSSIQVSLRLDGSTASDQQPDLRKTLSHANSRKHTSIVEVTPDAAAPDVVKVDNGTKAVEVLAERNDDCAPVCMDAKSSGSCLKGEDKDTESSLKNEVKPITDLERLDVKEHIVSNEEGKLDNLSSDNPNVKKAGLHPQDRAHSNGELQEVDLSERGSVAASEPQIFTERQIKLANKAHEDSILEEARSIEAKRKRIAELSVGRLPLVYRRKSHWDFVLEEMAWLANDFRQERLWKKAAAAQISHSFALNVRSRVEKQNLLRKQRNVAHTVAKAVMEFWRSAEMLLDSDDAGLSLQKVDEGKAVDHMIRDSNMDMSVDIEEKGTGKKSSHCTVQGYAVRFLQYSSTLDCPILAEAPVTPESVSDSVSGDMLWTDQFVEETLFYRVPPGAMEVYRKSVEDFWSQYEKTGGNVYQEEVDTSVYDAVSGFGSRENTFEEDEREVGTYYLPGAFEGRNSPKLAQKKRRNLLKAYSRPHEVGAGSPYSQFPENKMGTHSIFQGKRPSNSLDVGQIPTKRVRTAARPRVVSPYGSGAPGGMQMPSKTDASSGDTNSFQDDQSTAHGGSQIRRMDMESTGEYGKQLALDYTEVSMKLKKKKKTKHPLYKNLLNSTETGSFIAGKGSAYEQRCQHESMVQNEQRDYSKKRDNHAFESNGLLVPQAAKRPKINKQLQDTSPESIAPVNGSIPSPAASQMSNMSNPNQRIMKIFAGRDRGRKSKSLKMTAGQSGSGSAWSLFEDQALVVLVHDMGPNWELISDAINSTLQFKSIYRKAKECKERHKILMDRNAGDGADSAEDSGSSQPYPSTLPGIPKGSARQLFQHLQGPMEEDTLKSHFEKIIFIGKKLNSRRSQGLKQIVQVHSSHLTALSQVCPNNLNGVTLTPRDLCEATSSSSDILPLGYQGSNPGGVAISNQGPGTSILPTSGTNSVIQGPSSMAISNSLPSPSTATNASSRDGQRYGTPRASSLPIDEHQKIQQYAQMLSGRNIQHSSLPSPGSISSDRGVRMLSGGNGTGVMSGMNRGMPMPRPGYQGIGPPSMLNMVSSGSMLSTNGVGMPNPANMHNGAVPGNGSSMMRTREGLHMMRNPDDQRQIMMQELQMQVTQGNSQGIPPYNGLSAGYPNQPTSVQTFPAQQQQQHQMPPQQSHMLGNPHHTHLQGGNHATTPQQQAMMSRLAKERQRMIHQHHHQQNQFVASNSSMPHTQSHSQHPASPSLQNSSQIQQQASSQAMSLPSPNAQHPLAPASPMNPTPSQSQQKQHILPPHGLGRNAQAGGGNLPMLKQRQWQHQQLQQPGRHHPQQRQQPSQQQAKVMKGVGRANMIMHQNIPIDPSQVNGVATAPGNQIPEKGEQAMHMMHGQGLYSGSGSNPIQPGKSSLVPPQSSNQCSQQHKLFSRSPSPSSKPLSQMASHADTNHQGQVPAVSSAHSLLASQQPVLPLGASSSQHQQTQQTQTGQSQQAVHRILQQNHPVTSDPPSVQSSVDHVQGNQLPTNGTFQMGTSTSIPQSCSEATSVIPVTSGCTLWKSQEPIYDRGIPNSASHLATAGNQSTPSSVGNDSASLPSQGLAQRPFSGSVPSHAHTQWQSQTQQQKQPPQSSSPSSSSSSSQQQKQSSAPVQHPPPPSLQTQAQQMQREQPHHQQHLQAGEGALYDRTTDS